MKKKTNSTKQDEVVSALWQFARDQHYTHPINERGVITDATGVRINTKAVGTALETIMQIFGYEVVEIR